MHMCIQVMGTEGMSAMGLIWKWDIIGHIWRRWWESYSDNLRSLYSNPKPTRKCLTSLILKHPKTFINLQKTNCQITQGKGYLTKNSNVVLDPCTTLKRIFPRTWSPFGKSCLESLSILMKQSFRTNNKANRFL